MVVGPTTRSGAAGGGRWENLPQGEVLHFGQAIWSSRDGLAASEERQR